jgi:hypothetical protein
MDDTLQSQFAYDIAAQALEFTSTLSQLAEKEDWHELGAMLKGWACLHDAFQHVGESTWDAFAVASESVIQLPTISGQISFPSAHKAVEWLTIVSLTASAQWVGDNEPDSDAVQDVWRRFSPCFDVDTSNLRARIERERALITPKSDSTHPVPDATVKAEGKTAKRHAQEAGKKRGKSKSAVDDSDSFSKLIGALTLYHKYANGVCSKTEPPIGVRELSRQAEVSPSRSTDFFNVKFNHGIKGGHSQYKRQCGDKDVISHALRILNDDVTPAILSGSTKREAESDDEETEE